MVLLGPLIRPEVELPAVPPVVFPLIDEPVVVPPVAEPPVELPPAVPPLLCASANVLVSASAPANAIVVILMVVSFVGGGGKPKEPTYVPPPRAALDHDPIRLNRIMISSLCWSARRDAPKPAANQYCRAHAGQLRPDKSHNA